MSLLFSILFFSLSLFFVIFLLVSCLLLIEFTPRSRDTARCNETVTIDTSIRRVAQVYRPSEAMDWPGKNKPEAEPGCGFLNEHCPKDDTHLRSIVAAGVLAVLLFCAAVITMSIYRRWKIEQEIEGLLWKIDPSEIHGYPHLDNMMSSPSKVRTF